MTLRRARKQAKLSQQQLAGRAAVDHSTIAKLELEPTRYLGARYETIIRIALALGRDPLHIFPVQSR